MTGKPARPGSALSHMPLSGALSWNTRTRICAVGSGRFDTVTVTLESSGPISAPPLLYVPAAVGSTDTKYRFSGSTFGSVGAAQPSPWHPAPLTGM